MSGNPLVVFAIRYSRKEDKCLAQRLIRKAEQLCSTDSIVGCKLGEGGRELLRPVIAAKPLYTAPSRGETTEVWLRVSGEPEALHALETAMKREKGVSFQVVSGNKYNAIIRLIVPRERCCRECSWCPLVSAPPGSMVKSVVITGSFFLVELIVAKPQALRALENSGYTVIYSTRVDEVDYALTVKQEIALVLAFLYGYYSYPRRVSVKELAAKLRISSSALAELLRKAELKVITRYVMEELPHYLVQQVMSAAFVPRARDSEKE